MTIGERLKEERKRVGANQTVFAELCGVTKNTQLAYEKDERSPDANYLLAAAAQGVDVLYVVTGARVEQMASGLDDQEAQLLGAFRSMPEQQQAAFLLLSTSIHSPSAKPPLADKP